MAKVPTTAKPVRTPAVPCNGALTLVVAQCLAQIATIAHADGDREGKAGILVLEVGRAADALKAAEDGHLERKQARFLFLKALALEQLGRIADAWQVIQLVLSRKDVAELFRPRRRQTAPAPAR